MRESKIEKHLAMRVKEAGGLCWKFSSPNLRGVPDRVVILTLGRLCWVELKAPGKLPNVLQLRRHADLRARGHRVVVLDSIEAVDAFVEESK
jgi:hypothetical protein